MSEPTDLGRRAARGVISTGVAQALRLVVQTASVVVLSRLLLPAEFGAFAVAWGVVGLVDLVRDLGLQAAAVRARELSHQQSSNLFWLGLALGGGLAVLVAVAAPFVGPVLGGDDVGLAILGMAPLFLLSGALSQYRALLARALRFPVLNTVDVAAAVAGLVVAVVAALAGLGFWSLVIQLLVGSTLSLVAYASITRWRPTRFRSGHGTRAFVTFGGTVLLGQVFTYATNTVDSTLVGLTSGQAAAGEYNRGAQLVRTPLRQVQAPIGQVAVPVVARLPVGDPRVHRFLRSSQVALSLPVFAATAVCAAVPSESVRVALGPGWQGTVPVFVLIALAMSVGVVGSTGSWALIAHGDARTVALLTATTGTTTLTAMGVGAVWGPVGVAAGILVAAVVNVPVNLVVLQRLGVLRSWPLLAAGARTALAAGAAGLLAHGAVAVTGASSPFLAVAIAVVVTVGVMAAVVLAWPALRRDVRDVLDAARAARRPTEGVPPATPG